MTSQEEYASTELRIKYKKIAPIKAKCYYSSSGEDSENRRSIMQRLVNKYGSLQTGPLFQHHNFGTIKDDGTYDIYICIPVSESKDDDEFVSDEIAGGEVISTNYTGGKEKFKEVNSNLREFILKTGTISAEYGSRRVYHELADKPENDKIEFQIFVNPWTDRMIRGLREETEVSSQEILKGIDEPRFDSTIETKCSWIAQVLERLDSLDKEGVTFKVVSSCSHVFPPIRLEKPKQVYDETGDIDAVLRVMEEDSWLKGQKREGDKIIAWKNPSNPEGYKKAKTKQEKDVAYCFCPFVKHVIMSNDIDLSPSFCNCSSGWFRTIWEPILGEPVKIEILRSILNGDDECRFAIHIPEK